MYLDYDEYQSMGGTLNQTEYGRLEYRAQAELDNVTFNRITNADERVKRCIFELVDLLANNSNGNAEVASISNDGYSVNYASGGNNSSLSARIYGIIHTYFCHTDLMYCGSAGLCKE